MSERKPIEGFNRSLAFLVAIDRYGNGVPELVTPVSDAMKLAEVLERDHGFETRVIKNEDATNEALLKFLNGLADSVGKDDRVLFYFAGHGIAVESDDGPKGYLLPQDADRTSTARYLPMVELNGKLSALPCRHMLVILDCCFAGAFRWSSTRDLALRPEQLHRERYEWFIQDAAWQAIASAAHDQKAIDVLGGEPLGLRDAEQEHSPFAYALIAGLGGAADLAPVGKAGDGVITATELFVYLEEQLIPPLGSERRRQTPILWPLQKHDKGQFVFLVPGRELNLPAAPPLDPDANPWRGLKPYESAHSDLFFGRRRASEKLAERVLGKEAAGEQPAIPAETFVVVTGPSGIGKSSLVRAGLLPRLPDSVHPIVVRPGPTPFASLAAALRQATPPGASSPDEQALKTVPSALADWVKTQAKDHEILLVVDQAEELVTMNRDAEVAKSYLGLIARVLSGAEHLRVLFTIRTEFEPQFAQSPLKERWPAARCLVPQMTQDELRRVIEGPAAVKVLRFESSELVDTLVNEVVQMPGALPLLSFALSEMYAHYIQRRGDDRALTHVDYDALQGGVTGSLRVRANQVVDGVDEAHQETARRVLERLVSVGSGEFARRRVARRELEAADKVENVRVDEVLWRLDEARLVVTDSVDDVSYLELAHDALILGWDRLLNWVRKDTQRIFTLRRLTLDAEDWMFSKKSGLLWSDPARLAAIKDLSENASPGLNRVEVDFAKASIRRARRNQIIRWSTAAALILLTLGSAWLAKIADDRRAESLNRLERTLIEEAQLLAAESGRALDSGDAIKAALLSSSALPQDLAKPERPFTGEALTTLLRAIENDRLNGVLRGHLEPVTDIRLSRDSKRVLTVSRDRTARLWDAATASSDLTFTHPTGIKAAALSPDGQQVITGAEDGTVTSYSSANGKILAQKRLEHGSIVRLEFIGSRNAIAAYDGSGVVVLTNGLAEARTLDASGRVLAFITDNSDHIITITQHEIQSWRSDSWEMEVSIPVDGASARALNAISAVVFHPDSGGLLLIATGNETRLYCMSQRQGPAWIGAAGKTAISLGLRLVNLPGRTLHEPGTLAIGAAFIDGTAGIWLPHGLCKDSQRAVATEPQPQSPNYLDDGLGRYQNITFDPNENRVATVSHDGKVRIWTLGFDGFKPVLTLAAHEASANLVIFDQSGNKLLTSSADNTVRLWDVRARYMSTLVEQHDHIISSARFSPDGQKIYASSWHGTGLVWSLTQGVLSKRSVRDPEMSTSALCAAIRPDHRQIALGGFDGTVRIWELGEPDGQRPLQVFKDIGIPLSMDYSPNGRWLAVATKEGSIRIWNSETFRETPLLRHGSRVNAVRFSPDGDWLASASVDGTIALWRVALKFERVATFQLGSEATSVAFSPTGSLLVAGLASRVAIIVSLPEGRQLGSLQGHELAIRSVAWSANGHWIATGSDDWTVRLWDAERGVQAAILPHEERIASVDFDPSGSRLLTAAWDRRIRIWSSPRSLWDLSSLDLLVYSRAAIAGGLTPRVQQQPAANSFSWFSEADDSSLCDAAADPEDRSRRNNGYALLRFEGRRVADACRAKLVAAPNDPRLHHQLARSLEQQGRLSEAYASYQAAADRGYGPAQLALARRLAISEPTRLDAVVVYARAAAKNGTAGAEWLLAELYWRGLGMAADRSAAVKLYGEAAAHGSPEGHVRLGHLFEHEVGDDTRKWAIWHYAHAADLLRGRGEYVLAKGQDENRARVALSLAPVVVAAVQRATPGETRNLQRASSPMSLALGRTAMDEEHAPLVVANIKQPRLNGKTLDGCIQSSLFPYDSGCSSDAGRLISQHYCNALGFDEAVDFDRINTGQFQNSYKFILEPDRSGLVETRWADDSGGGFIFSRISCRSLFALNERLR